MKKLIIFVLSLTLLAAILSGCGNAKKQETKGISIVTTIFPEYDWVKNILGTAAENAEVTMLLDTGVDLHSFQPSAQDIIRISTCDLFIYVGGESDMWVNDALKEATNKEMIVMNLLDILGDAAREEELVDGMESEEDEEDGETEYDEHVWLSLKNAQIFTEVIKDALCKIDVEHSEIYAVNSSNYIEKLKELDERYEKTVQEGTIKTLLFGDRFPFLYFTEDYGLEYFAAFAGCSAESEASFETIAFLSGKLDELGLKNVLILEGNDLKIAETVIASSKRQDAGILEMNSMQSTTSEDVKKGQTYLSIMEKNLDVLKEALN